MTVTMDPDRQMGMFSRLDQVPRRYRLETYSAEFKGRDVWSEWLESDTNYESFADTTQRYYDTAESRWKDHLERAGRHHALATPSIVESWISDLLSEYAVYTVWERFWRHIENFYKWLCCRTDFPHCYNPVLMAAATRESCGTVWDQKVRITHDSR